MTLIITLDIDHQLEINLLQFLTNNNYQFNNSGIELTIVNLTFTSLDKLINFLKNNQ